MTSMDIAQRIRNARTKRGLTQADLAKALGLTPQAISNYESGKRDLKQSVLVDIAHALDTDVFELMGYDPSGMVTEGDKRHLEEDFLRSCPDFECLEDDSSSHSVDIFQIQYELVKKLGISVEAAEQAEKIVRAAYTPFFRTPTEQAMHPFLEDLNETGKKVAIERIAELAEIPKYVKQSAEEE